MTADIQTIIRKQSASVLSTLTSVGKSFRPPKKRKAYHYQAATLHKFKLVENVDDQWTLLDLSVQTTQNVLYKEVTVGTGSLRQAFTC